MPNEDTARKVRWEEFLPEELVLARDRCPVCYMAYGLAEPHGPYNALGLDWLKAQALVEAAAREHGGMVAPPCAWHIMDLPEFHDDGHGHGWLCDAGVKQSLTSSIPSDLFYHLVLHQLRCFDARGFHAAILVTGHYGGVELVLRWLCEHYLRRTHSPLRLAAIADWEVIDRDLPWRGDHAGMTETSQLMALRPGLTDLSRRAVPPELGTRFAGTDFAAAGVTPSAEIGRQIVTSQVRNLGQLSRELLSAWQPCPGYVAPNQHEVEAIWARFDQLTRRYWTLSYNEYRAGKCFKFPGWDVVGD